MKKIKIQLTKTGWQLITSDILRIWENSSNKRIGHLSFKNRMTMHKDNELMRCVYIKLHNKLHSLKENNNLILSVPEAAVFAIWLTETQFDHIYDLAIIEIIDRKLS